MESNQPTDKLVKDMDALSLRANKTKTEEIIKTASDKEPGTQSESLRRSKRLEDRASALQQHPAFPKPNDNQPHQQHGFRLDANAPNFNYLIPTEAESVSSLPVLKMLNSVNKQCRPAKKANGGTDSRVTRTSKRNAPKNDALQQQQQQQRQPVSNNQALTFRPASPSKPQLRNRNNPRLRLMERPVASREYLLAAQEEHQALEISRPLLVILDLNGTLLFRKNRGATFTGRPHVSEFLDYLFRNHRVMVWSSARPENVAKMCETLFTPEQRKKVVAVWGRDRLGLTPEAYNAKSQVYKQLSWVWDDPSIQATNPNPDSMRYWTQSNTVLIDDSVEKAASEPYNLVEIEEFEARPDQMDTDVLGQVAVYLDTLRSQRDVSSFIRSSPFRFNPAPAPKAQQRGHVFFDSDEGGVPLA